MKKSIAGVGGEGYGEARFLPLAPGISLGWLLLRAGLGGGIGDGKSPSLGPVDSAVVSSTRVDITQFELLFGIMKVFALVGIYDPDPEEGDARVRFCITGESLLVKI